MNDAMQVFDRQAVRRHRDRAAAGLNEYDFLFRQANDILIDRLDDIRRAFPRVLDLGCRTGGLAAALQARTGMEMMVQSDLSQAMVSQADGLRLVSDEEFGPFAPDTFDLVVSCLNLHWVNDLPGALIQIRQSLKPDGLFLAALFGGETLTELRQAFLKAEMETMGGAGPRISPMIDIRDAGGLLQRAGFALPVADTETLTVSYGSALKLMRDLRGMGESHSASSRRKSFTRRDTIARAAAIYGERFAGEDGRMLATFEIIMLTGWAPSPDQPQPLARGSGQVSLGAVLSGDDDEEKG
ncbi:MAG: methyltransferase domain-containing protein [Rhodospirillaceae bacterium]|jgi:NADH dehydrogenase [ubiquinone] 1 alpha subcomplex assembly factor 5